MQGVIKSHLPVFKGHDIMGRFYGKVTIPDQKIVLNYLPLNHLQLRHNLIHLFCSFVIILFRDKICITLSVYDKQKERILHVP